MPKQIHHHQFAVEVPARWDESQLRRPPHRKKARVFRKPIPLHAIEDGVSEVVDILVLKMLPASEHAAKQDRGIDRGDL